MRFLIIDDHPLFREALSYAVKATYVDALVEECADFDEALAQLKLDDSYDLAMLDLRIPGATGFDGLLQLRTRYPRLPVVIVSGLEDREVVKTAMSYGIAGFIPKSTKKEELTFAIKSVIDGQVYLPESVRNLDESSPTNSDAGKPASDMASFTPQQLKVIGMIRDGMLNKQIAYELGVSETTVKAHVSKILKKLGVTNRTQAAMEIEKLNANDPLIAHERFGNH